MAQVEVFRLRVGHPEYPDSHLSVTVSYEGDSTAGTPFSVLLHDVRKCELVQVPWADWLRIVEAVKSETEA